MHRFNTNNIQNIVNMFEMTHNKMWLLGYKKHGQDHNMRMLCCRSMIGEKAFRAWSISSVGLDMQKHWPYAGILSLSNETLRTP